MCCDMHVMLVDDDPDIIEMLRAALRKNGWMVTTASSVMDARHAWDILEYTAPADLLIVDFLLLGGTAADVVRHVRESGSDVPILVISGCDDVEEQMEDWMEDVDAVVRKPFDLAEFLPLIRTMYERAGCGTFSNPHQDIRAARALSRNGVADADAP